jgi:hypothetical protein
VNGFDASRVSQLANNLDGNTEVEDCVGIDHLSPRAWVIDDIWN